MEDRVMFGKYFVGNLLQLKDDRVINVRLALAEFIRDIRNMRDVKKK
jgi:hypothetical protein